MEARGELEASSLQWPGQSEGVPGGSQQGPCAVGAERGRGRPSHPRSACLEREMRTLCCMWTLCCGGERRSRFLARVCRASVLIPVLSSLCWSRKFLKSLVRKQPQELLLVIGTGVSAAVAPGIPALCSWRSCIEAVIEAAEQLEVLHPGDVAEFRRKVVKDRDLLVVAHDLIRKMSPRTGDTKPNFFQDCLMEVFDSLEQHIQSPLVLQSILGLMDRGTMVLTTNYDNLLELFGQQQNRPMESLDLKDKTKVLQWARGHIKYGVLHIHGLYTDPCGMVLDPSGYKDVTQDPEVMVPACGMHLDHCLPSRPPACGNPPSGCQWLFHFQSWKSCRTCTAPSPSCSWAVGRPCATRYSRRSSSTRCPTRWTWSTTCWCSRTTRTTSTSTRLTCCCTASRSCPTGTDSTSSRGTCRTSPPRSAGSAVQTLSEWTAPRCWAMHVRTVRRGRWRRTGWNRPESSDTQMMPAGPELFLPGHTCSVRLGLL
nr:protein FAM118A isoform X2 [Cavia porcellus]